LSDAPEKGGGPLPGSVSEQFVRCGKAYCRCGTGKLHGPYYYRIWRGEAGKVHKVYVKSADLAQVRARCARHRAIAEEFRAFCVQTEALAALLRVQVGRSKRLRAALARGCSGGCAGWV